MKIVVWLVERLIGLSATLLALIVISYTVLYFSPFGLHGLFVHDRVIQHGTILHEEFFVYLITAVRKIVTLNLNLPLPVLLHAIVISFTIAMSSIIIACVVGAPIGVWAATRPRKWFPQFLSVVTLAGQALPPIVIALVVLMFVAIHAPSFPTLGWGSIGQAVLPIGCMVLSTVGYMTQFMQAGMRETLDQAFLLTARSHGLPEWRVILRHGLRPSALSMLTFIGPQTAIIVSGTLFVERVFSIPGLGAAMTQGADIIHQMKQIVATGAYPPIGMVGMMMPHPTIPVGQLAILGFLVLMVNLIIDIAYLWLNPRLRRGNRAIN